MAMDISGALAKEIDEGKSYASSENLSCGKNDFMVTRIRGELIDSGNSKTEYAFIEMLPLTSESNPQIEGDRQGWGFVNGAYVPGTGPLIDDGTHPNQVGVPCAVKANFTGNRKVAAAKIKKFFLAAWNLREENLKPGEVGGAWKDASRQVAGWYVKGWTVNGQVVPAGTPNAEEDLVMLLVSGGAAMPVTKDTPGAVWKDANPMAGFVVRCVTKNQKKRTPNEKGAYIGVQTWIPIATYNEGENSKEARSERLTKHTVQSAPADDVIDDDGADDLLAAATAAATATTNGANGHAATAAPSAPQPPAAPVAPVAPAGDWPPPAPWIVGGTSPAHAWLTAGYVWKDGMPRAISEADYRAGKRG